MLTAACFAVVALVAPKGCGLTLDARRADTCRRALPAIVPPDARVDVLRVAPGPIPDSVRVEYRLTDPVRGDTRSRWIDCRFGPGTSLDAVATESGPVSGASVYLLKHYYLDTPEAKAADPGGR